MLPTGAVSTAVPLQMWECMYRCTTCKGSCSYICPHNYFDSNAASAEQSRTSLAAVTHGGMIIVCARILIFYSIGFSIFRETEEIVLGGIGQAVDPSESAKAGRYTRWRLEAVKRLPKVRALRGTSSSLHFRSVYSTGTVGTECMYIDPMPVWIRHGTAMRLFFRTCTPCEMLGLEGKIPSFATCCCL